MDDTLRVPMREPLRHFDADLKRLAERQDSAVEPFRLRLAKQPLLANTDTPRGMHRLEGDGASQLAVVGHPNYSEAASAAYVSGSSTRDVGNITEALVGDRVSRSTVSRVTASLEEKVEQLRKAPIARPIPYLFPDATFLDAR